MATIVVMPQLGNTVESCLIISWQVQVGDEVAENQILCEVETQLFSTLLDSHVQRLATIAHGDGVCTTHVPHVRPRKHFVPTETIRKKA